MFLSLEDILKDLLLLLVLVEFLHLGFGQLLALDFDLFYANLLLLVLELMLVSIIEIWILLQKMVTCNQPWYTKDLLDGLELSHFLWVTLLSLNADILEEVVAPSDLLHELLGLDVISILLRFFDVLLQMSDKVLDLNIVIHVLLA